MCYKSTRSPTPPTKIMPEKMRVCNTSQYNTSLKGRGHVFDHFTEIKESWFEPELRLIQQMGAPPVYSDALILKIHIVRYLFGLSLRAVTGLFEDMVQNFYKDPTYTVPHYSVICRRLKKLKVPIKDHRKDKKDGPIEICIDSSGINIYSTGGGHSKENAEARQHKGLDQVRKMHVALDAESGDVEDLIMTKGTKADHKIGAILIENLPESVENGYADAAYDRKPFRKACALKNIKQIIPAIQKAIIRKPGQNDPSHIFDERNESIRLRRQYSTPKEGDTAWRKQNKYGNRAHVEAFFGRFKRRFSFYFVSRSDVNRAQELRIKTRILNDFNKLGRAQYEKVA